MSGRNGRRLISLELLLALAPFSASAREVWIYVTDSGGDRVEVIDPTANKVVQVIGGIALPTESVSRPMAAKST
jgi:YVTN family beta-propeller protein